MVKKILLLAAFASLTISISANTNTNELEKFNSAKSTISFTENKGQISDQNYNPRPDVLFSGEANGLTFHIRKDGISYQTSRVDSWKQQDKNLPEGMREEGKTDSVPDQMTIYRTDINWLGFNRDYTIENGESTAGFNNYYLPSCPDGAMNVKSYTDVTFKNLYAGIDVKWYEKNGELEYDFILAPNADYTKISWEIKGADKISIGENGQLIIETPLGNIEEQAPIAFQGETMVEATWKIDGNNISFQLGSYNENEVLIIDPVVRQWGTYYGGTGQDYGLSCATDTSGNIYLAGITRSTSGIATTGAHQTNHGGYRDAFLVKFNSSGVRQWGTYYGGTGNDFGWSCATDTSGNIYLSGQTPSTSGIATTGAYQTTFGGATEDAFLVKFDACPATYSQDTITACDSYTWIDGVTYTLSDTTAKHTLVNAAGCDSIVSLFLTINNSTSAIDTITACDSYTWIDGVTYTSSDTTAKDTLVNAAGCDSIVSLFLTINNSTSAIDTITACDSYTWIDGVTYTASNTTAKDTLLNAAGCDSIVSLNLTINYTKTTTDSIVANDSYTWINGVTYTSSNTTVTDTLLASNGCDSIVSLNLTIVSTVGIDNSAILSNVKVYPNPTEGNVNIEIANNNQELVIEIFNAVGTRVATVDTNSQNNGSFKADLSNLASGLYIVRVKSGATVTTQRITLTK